MKKKYYQLVDEEPEADLYIFGNIEADPWDDDSKGGSDIVKELREVTAPAINVHINSYGGDVSEGLAIYNVLRESGKTVTTIDDGFACSAASVIFMAGTNRIMNPASLLMIHNAWACACGNANDFRKQADDLDIITSASIQAYKSVANISEEEIKKLMDDETWITPQDAFDYGFATAIDGSDPEGPQQSAQSLIMQKLTEPRQNQDQNQFDQLEKEIRELIDLTAKKPEGIEKKDPWKTFFEKKGN